MEELVIEGIEESLALVIFANKHRTQSQMPMVKSAVKLVVVHTRGNNIVSRPLDGCGDFRKKSLLVNEVSWK